jgi:hypothetical protein
VVSLLGMAAVVLLVISFFITDNNLNKIVLTISAVLGISLVVQVILFLIKPSLFKNK